MLENVASMSDQDAKVITAALDAIGVRINSSLVSGQFRDRYYWTNIPGTELNLFGNYLIQPPINRNIHFADILESGTTNRDKALCLSARGGGRWAHIIKNEKYKTSNNQIQLLKRNSKGFDNIVFEDGYVRLLTRRELELLQTVPEGYTDCVTYEQAFNLLGDGWTIEVIKHIFKNIEL